MDGIGPRSISTLFGLPADLELFARLIDRHGLADVDDTAGGAGRIRRMAGELCGPGQAGVLAEFRHERRNLSSTVVGLAESGRYEQAVTLLLDSLPLYVRSCGVAELLPLVLQLIRGCGPMGEAAQQDLDHLAVRVFLAAGEREAAEFYYEQMVLRRVDGLQLPRGAELLGVLVAEASETDEIASTLASCVQSDVSAHDLAGLCESAAAYFSLLMRMGKHERVAEESQALLLEAMRFGDEYVSALMLLWQAAACCGEVSDDLVQHRVERALAKLRPLGQEALLSAAAMVIGVRSPNELETLRGALGSTEAMSRMLRDRFASGERVGAGLGEAVSSAELHELFPLTRRESDVAGLVAGGLTNKQIARRLGISVWTVTNHLRQVMHKLDCVSRAQVAKRVREVASAGGQTVPAS